jgi:hypothetical protein
MGILLAFIAIIAFISGDLSKKTDFDTITYDKEVSKFVENEKNALKVFKVIETAKPDYLNKELSKGLVLWNENSEIIQRLNENENLPQKLHDQNEKLLKYCELRIKSSEIMIKALTEKTDKYASEIDSLGIEINQILKDLKSEN